MRLATDGPKIKTINLKAGGTKYRFVIDEGRDPDTGNRIQKTYTFDSKTEAKNKRAEIIADKAKGVHVVPSKKTLNNVIDEWLPSATQGLSENTKVSYRDAFLPARERLGERPFQELAKKDFEDLKTWMLESGRRRGGKPGTGLSGRTVNYTLGRLRTLYHDLWAEDRVARNVVKLVKNVSHTKKKQGQWNRQEVRTFLAKAKGTRNEAGYRLTTYAMRRSEVLGQEWKEVEWGSFARPCGDHTERWCKPCYGKGDHYTHTSIAIMKARVLVDYKVVVKDPKSDNAFRRLPADVEVAAALHDLWEIQQIEKQAAGTHYRDTGWIFVDSLGEPIHPERYTDDYHRIRTAAGLRRITLRDQRSVSLSLMEKAGVPISIISAWAGHYDPAFTYKEYVVAEEADLKEGMNVLAALQKPA